MTRHIGGGLKFCTFVVIRAWLRFSDSYLLLELYHVIDFYVPLYLFGFFLFTYIVYRMTVLTHFSENFSCFIFLIITHSQNYFKNIVLLPYNVNLGFCNKGKNYYLTQVIKSYCEMFRLCTIAHCNKNLSAYLKFL